MRACNRHSPLLRLPDSRHGQVPQARQASIRPERAHYNNSFDIGNYEQISTAEKQHMLKELTWFIMSEGYETINEFTQPALERFGEQYWEIMVSYSAFLVKYLNGNKMMREKAEMQKRLAWEEAMRERCRNNEADSHSGE